MSAPLVAGCLLPAYGYRLTATGNRQAASGLRLTARNRRIGFPLSRDDISVNAETSRARSA
ncbi:hypothetical protein C7S13_6312 [Burkholderia cepacia]|nr:hypothetical protein [Burkholderia cepacia]